MTKHHIPKASEARSPADHMIAIGKAGENIKNGYAVLVSGSGIHINEADNGDGTMTYSWDAGSATVRHK